MNKTIVITGAGRGLGLALAKVYRAGGDTVIGGCRVPKNAEELGATGAEVVVLDMADLTSVAAFSEAIGERPVNALFNCAGVDARNFGIEDARRDAMVLDPATFEAVMRVNVTGPYALVQCLAPNLRAVKGTIVNISSQVGSFEVARRIGRDVSYAASKTALNMVTLKQSQVLGPDGVTVIAMHPGWLKTDMGGSSADLDPAEAAAAIAVTVAALTPAQNGQFIRWDGQLHPW